MTLLSILAALLWEQYRPLKGPLLFEDLFTRWNDWLAARLGGARPHWLVAWALGALVPALVALLVSSLVSHASVVMVWAWNVAILYLATGFKGITFACATTARAIKEGDLERARESLAEWRLAPLQGDGLEDATELSRDAIESLLRLALVRLFGVLFWFVLLGVFGAVLYRLSHLCHRRWQGDPDSLLGQAITLLDWLPTRVAALGFAIAGNFEDALYGWRTQATGWPDRNEGVLLATAAGALGVRLGGERHVAGEVLSLPELGSGEAAAPEFVDGAVALVWRVVLIWLAALGLVWLGGL